MTWFSVDVEADGPCPDLYSMVSIGVVAVRENLEQRFYAELRPTAVLYKPKALAVSGFTREQCLEFPPAYVGMRNLRAWLQEVSAGRPTMISDNPGFDWQFVNYYFHTCCGENPFGWSCRDLNGLYKGFVKDARKSFKHLRRTKHNHNALEDALGNAEALLALRDKGLKINLV